MNEDYNIRVGFARNIFRSNLAAMREKGIVEELELSGYVCDDCNVENPIGYKIIADHREESGDVSCLGIVVCVIAVIVGIVFFPLGILIALGGLGYGAYLIIQGRRGKEGRILIYQDELACAACYGSPINIDSTRGKAILRRIQENQQPPTSEGTNDAR